MTTALERHLQDQLKEAAPIFWHRVRWCAVREIVARQQPEVIADIGAGAGLLAEFMKRDRIPALYVFEEPLESLCRFLEARHGAGANTAGAPLEASLVTLLDVIEHQADDGAFLEGLLRRMEPGSTLVITVPALQVLWSAWDVEMGHHRRYTKRSLRQLLAGVPVEVVEVSYLFPELVLPALLRRVSRRSVDGESRAEFPVLPKWLNAVLYGIGRVTLRLRRFCPIGTSLFAVVRVDPSHGDPEPPLGRTPVGHSCSAGR